MKIQLDTTAKVIKVEETVNLGELIDVLGKLLPKEKWRDFKLETNTIINWSNPIVIEPYRPYIEPYRPVQPYVPINPWPIKPWWEQPWITYGVGDKTEPTTYSLADGTFNIEY